MYCILYVEINKYSWTYGYPAISYPDNLHYLAMILQYIFSDFQLEF